MTLEQELAEIRKEQFDVVPNDVPLWRQWWNRIVLFFYR